MEIILKLKHVIMNSNDTMLDEWKEIIHKKMTNQVCYNITVTSSSELVIRKLFPEFFMVVNLSIYLCFSNGLHPLLNWLNKIEN